MTTARSSCERIQNETSKNRDDEEFSRTVLDLLAAYLEEEKE